MLKYGRRVVLPAMIIGMAALGVMRTLLFFLDVTVAINTETALTQCTIGNLAESIGAIAASAAWLTGHFVYRWTNGTKWITLRDFSPFA